MAVGELTLTQAEKLSTDILRKGVIEIFARTSPVLEMLPFMEIVGNSYQYNVEKELADVAFREVNEGYTASHSVVEQKNEGLVILGGDVDVDNFLVKTRGNVNDIRALQTTLKSKALAKEFTKNFFYGDSAVNPKSFNGLKHKVASYGQVIDLEGGEITLDALNELLDAVEGGPDVLYMNKIMRRKIQAILQNSTHYIQNGTDEFGRRVDYYGDVQIRTIEDGIIPVTEGNTEIFAVKFGADEYVSGLRNGSVSVRDLGELDEKPVYRTRIEFYCGLAMFHPKSACVLTGVKVSASGE